MRTLPLGWLLGLSIVALTPAARADDCNGNGIDDAVDLAGPAVRGYWRFEEADGPVLDSGPNGLVGTATNADASEDVSRGRIPRTGDDNVRSIGLGGDGRVVVPDPAGRLTFGGTGFTIEAWVRIDTLSDTSGPNQRQFLVQKKGLGAADTSLDYAVLVQRGGDYTGLVAHFGKTSGHSGRELMVLFGTGGGTWAVTSNLEITDTGWHHVAVSHDGTARAVRFAVDGRLETIEAPGPAHATNGGPLVIGAHTSSSGAFNQFLRGAVDELRVLPGPVAPEQWLPSHAMADCNANAVPDGCDVASRTSPDCDADGQPDECQLVDGDCDANGVPDRCDPDCDDNGVPDACDIDGGTAADCQADGVPDTCQLASRVGLSYDHGWARIAWRADETYMAWLNRFNVRDRAGLVDGIEVLWGVIPLGTQVQAFVWTDPNGDGDPTDATVLWSGLATVNATDRISVVEVPGVDVGDTGASFFLGFMMEVTTEDFPAALDIDGVPVPDRSWGVGSWAPIDPNDLSAGAVEFGTVNDLLFGNVWMIRARMRGPGTDCDGNGVPDECDLDGGTAVDADGNGIPDSCEDCNANAIVDGLEIAGGTAFDLNADGVPDECQLAANDCNLDGIPDDVLLAESDCNGNGVLDACDIASGFEADANGNGRADSCEDCNGNRSLDPTDIKLGLSDDCDGDGVPDECRFGAPTEPSRYAYDDGVQEANLHFVGAVLDFAWMNRFTVEPGAEWISAVEVVWGDTYPDLPAEVVLWSDPDGDGNPTDAQVLVTVATRSMKIDFPPDNLNVVPIPPTRVGPAGTSFFVGVHFDDVWGSGKPVALDLDPPHSGQGWIAYQWNGPIDLNDLSRGGLLSWPHHDLLVRAIGSDGRFANDCDANGTLDTCDVAGGGSGDRNGNGVPDACETIGDLDGDGRVTAADLTIMLGSWGGRGAADLDGDGAVGPADLALLLGAWTG